MITFVGLGLLIIPLKEQHAPIIQVHMHASNVGPSVQRQLLLLFGCSNCRPSAQPYLRCLNRVTQISYSDSTPTAHYYYDSATGLPTGHPSYTPTNATGRLVAMTYGSGATGDYFNYD